MQDPNPNENHKPSRRRISRIVSNSLIAVGLMLFLGIGVFYAYAAYKEDQLTQRIEAQNKERAAEEQRLQEEAPPGVVPQEASPAGSGSSFAPPEEPLLPTPTPDATPTPFVEQPAPTRIVIPKIEVDSKIIEVRSFEKEINGETWLEWGVADWAVGHHDTSANPGEPGNIVLTGHDDVNGEVFRYLENLKPGDEVFVYSGDTEHKYTVDFMALVKEKDATLEERRENARYLASASTETLTLISCWPYGIDSHRIIVVARPVQSAK